MIKHGMCKSGFGLSLRKVILSSILILTTVNGEFYNFNPNSIHVSQTRLIFEPVFDTVLSERDFIFPLQIKIPLPTIELNKESNCYNTPNH